MLPTSARGINLEDAGIKYIFDADRLLYNTGQNDRIQECPVSALLALLLHAGLREGYSCSCRLAVNANGICMVCLISLGMFIGIFQPFLIDLGGQFDCNIMPAGFCLQTGRLIRIFIEGNNN